MNQDLIREYEAPPTAEEVHLPGPSIIPLLNAVGVAIALVGLTMSWGVVIAGAVLFLVTAVIWLRDTVRDIDQLPLDHGGH